jgi:hypothetical protein
MKKISKKVEDKHLTEDEAEILRRYTCFTGTCVTGTKVLAVLVQKYTY